MFDRRNRKITAVNTVSHNPAQSRSDNIPPLPPKNHITRMLSSRSEVDNRGTNVWQKKPEDHGRHTVPQDQAQCWPACQQTSAAVDASMSVWSVDSAARCIAADGEELKIAVSEPVTRAHPADYWNYCQWQSTWMNAPAEKIQTSHITSVHE